MWVPLVENNEHTGKGADYFIEKNIKHLLSQSKDIDTILLACTHYPLLEEKIREYLPIGVKLITQGEIVAASLQDYLERHPEIDQLCSRGSKTAFYTTDSPADFNEHASLFFGVPLHSQHADIEAAN